MSGLPMSSRPVVTTVDGTEMVLVLTNGKNFLVPLGLLATLSADPEFTKQSLGLDKVDNTSDEDKPLSAAAREAIAGFVTPETLSEQIAVQLAQIIPTLAPAQHGHEITEVAGLSEELSKRISVEQLAQAVADGKVGLAVEADVAARLAEKADKSALDGLAQVVASKATKADIEEATAQLATEEQLAAGLLDKASTAAVNELATAVSTKAEKADLEALAASAVTQDAVDEAIREGIANSGHVTAEVLDQKVAEAIGNSGHVTAEQLETAVEAAAAGKASVEFVQDQVSGLATKGEVATKADSSELTQIRQDVAAKATAQDIQNALGGYAKTTDVNEAVSTGVSGLEKTSDVDSKISGVMQAMEGKASIESLAAKVDQADFASAVETLGSKADKDDIPDVSGFLTQSQVAAAVTQMLADTPDFVRTNAPLVSRVIWVSAQADAAVATGSMVRPYKTIQAAVDAVPANQAGWTIIVQPANGNYAGFTVNGKINMMIQAFGANGAHAVVVNGTVKYEGASTTRIRLRDIAIRAPLNGHAFWDAGTLGRHYFLNVNMEPAAGTVAETVLFEGAYSNWTSFDDCAISGTVRLADGGSNPSVYFNGNNAADTHVVIDGDYKLFVSTAIQFGSVEHNNGEADIRQVPRWTGKGGVAVKSTAPTRRCYVSFSDLEQADGTFLSIEGENVIKRFVNDGAGV